MKLYFVFIKINSKVNKKYNGVIRPHSQILNYNVFQKKLSINQIAQNNNINKCTQNS